MPSEFEVFVGRVRAQVEQALAGWLEGRAAEARRRGADVAAVAEAVRSLALRGGKRMRAELLAAAYEACGGADAQTVTFAGVSLELLQAYLLAHDDWMDGDDVRRNGPSVPAMMRERFGNAAGGAAGGPGAASRADAMSVLAGDLGAAWARRALLEVPVDPARLVRAARELADVEEDVVEGQVLDVGAAADDEAAVELTHLLKTASYTVRGPVLMGAHLAGAGEDAVAALRAFSLPLGVAFQLRDDLLGVFGDSRATGKPAGNDLRAGKRSAVVVEALRMGLGPELGDVLGRPDASDAGVRAAVEMLRARAVDARIEDRIEALAREACAALDRATLTAHGRALLTSAVVALTHRQS